MSLNVIHVSKIVYCEIEIDDQKSQPSPNLIIQVLIHSGLGIVVPTLTMFLQDQGGHLQRDMNLVEGTKITITVVRDGILDKKVPKSFRVWSVKREIHSDGPQIKVVCIFDAPKWCTSVYCESYRATSDQALANMVAKSDLKFDGPEGGTDDNMNWLNVNTTRCSFAEDIVMRGYASETSCMSKVLTTDGVFKYKDLFALMKKDPVATFALNTDASGKTAPIYQLREMKENSTGGLMTHWVNYGQVQHGHTLEDASPPVIDGMDAPTFGPALPVNAKVKDQLEGPARVNYVGFDHGTEPHPHSNIHKDYEQAIYQNIRGLGLFSERLRVLTNQFTTLTEFDTIEYVQKDAVGILDVDSVSNNGKYIIAGKTISIKNGINYSEVFDIYRSYVYTGAAAKTGTDASGAAKGKANAGDDLTADRVAQLQGNTQATTLPTNQSIVRKKEDVLPEADQLNNLMDGLGNFDATNPAIPSTPLGGPGSLTPTSPAIVAQNDLAKAVADVNKGDSGLKDAMTISPDAFNPDRSFTVKKIPASVVELSANNSIDAVLQNQGEARDSAFNGVGLNGLSQDTLNSLNTPIEKPVLDRFTLDSGKDPLSELKTTPYTSIVSPATSSNINIGSFVTDPLKGGVFLKDFSDPSKIPSSLANAEKISAADHLSKFGTNFLFPAATFGLSPKDVLLHPKSVVDYAKKFVDTYKDPKKVLLNGGGNIYQKTFGTRMPTDASSLVETIASKIPKLSAAFGNHEVIAGDPNSTATQSGFQQALGGVLKIGKSVGLSPSINVSQWAVKGKVVDGITGAKNDTGFSKIFNFSFGRSGVAPLLEKAVSKQRITPTNAVESVSDAITMNRGPISWGTLAKMGSSNSQKQAAADPTSPQPRSLDTFPDVDYKQWTYPTTDTISEFNSDGGSAFSFSGTSKIT